MEIFFTNYKSIIIPQDIVDTLTLTSNEKIITSENTYNTLIKFGNFYKELSDNDKAKLAAINKLYDLGSDQDLQADTEIISKLDEIFSITFKELIDVVKFCEELNELLLRSICCYKIAGYIKNKTPEEIHRLLNN